MNEPTNPLLRPASGASRPTFGGLDDRILSRRHPPSTRAQAPFRVDGGRHRATVLFSAPDVCVVDKPAGWVVHDAGTDASVLARWVEALHPGLSPAHRLDRPTSGVVVFARGPELERWTKALAEHRVNKRYQALVYGLTREKGVIRRALRDGRAKSDLSAVTRYTRVEAFGKWSLLSVRPETGRKHQIRRHLQGIGHALIGDDRYRPRGKRTVPAFPGRLWLHAGLLELDGERFEAPLPPELARHLEHLRDRDVG